MFQLVLLLLITSTHEGEEEEMELSGTMCAFPSDFLPR